MERRQKGKKTIPPASEKMEINPSTSTEGSDRGRSLRIDPRETRERSTFPASLFGVIWPSLPGSSVKESPTADSLSIEPEQRPKTMNSAETQTRWRPKGESPEDYERDRVNKYAQYFQSNTIFPIPEVTKQQEMRKVSFIVTDLKLKRLAGLKKEVFR